MWKVFHLKVEAFTFGERAAAASSTVGGSFFHFVEGFPPLVELPPLVGDPSTLVEVLPPTVEADYLR
jgi:hypothetical protein